ncbi:hypothetical protein M432DRAFT_476129 [Thermoascus aurantiacus ATCC 26904]
MAAGSLCLESKAWMVASLEGRMITRRVCPMGGSLSYGLRMLCYGFGLLDILGIRMHRCMDIRYDMGWQRRQKKECVFGGKNRSWSNGLYFVWMSSSSLPLRCAALWISIDRCWWYFAFLFFFFFFFRSHIFTFISFIPWAAICFFSSSFPPCVMLFRACHSVLFYELCRMGEILRAYEKEMLLRT